MGRCWSLDAQVSLALNRAADDLAARRYREAHAGLMAVLKAAPATPEAFYLLGVLAADHLNHAKACELFDRAIALAPGEARFHAEKARSLVALFRRPEALAAADAAATVSPASARTLDTIGVVFSRLGLHARATDFYQRAVAREPGNPSYLYNLAAGLQFEGAFGPAEDAYLRAIAADPRHVKAWSSMVLMSRQTPEANHIERLEALFPALSDPDDRLHIGHALAKSYEDLGDVARTMLWLDNAKSAKRAAVDHDPGAIAGLFVAAANTALNHGPDPGACADPSPILIVGLPRTGTTLLDRILSSHSMVASAGELSDFALELKVRTATPSPYVLDPETLAAARALDLGEAAAAYIARARQVVGDAPRFIDKMPLNFFYSALLLKAAPNARIICLRRHPADTVLSNYRQMFATGYAYYNYGYDLGWTARYYAHFDRLITTFRERLPADRFTEVRYEDIVADLEGEARRLVAFCGLDWEPQCLAFHENAAPVATASSSQVRQPLYASSVARWKRYAAYMQPALDVLAREGVSLDG
jgi:tetratricopeptide (TPR) repeat protein